MIFMNKMALCKIDLLVKHFLSRFHFCPLVVLSHLNCGYVQSESMQSLGSTAGQTDSSNPMTLVIVRLSLTCKSDSITPNQMLLFAVLRRVFQL